jgi:hypothetical protein
MGHIAVLMQHDKIIQELVKKGVAVALLRRNTLCCVATRFAALQHVVFRWTTLHHVAPGARFDKEDKMGLTALHLAALMQNDKVDAALGATAPTSAPQLRWPHLRIYAYLYVYVYVHIHIKSVPHLHLRP